MTSAMRLALKNKLIKFFAFAQSGEPVDINVIKIPGGQGGVSGGGGGISNGLAAQLTEALIQAGVDEMTVPTGFDPAAAAPWTR